LIEQAVGKHGNHYLGKRTIFCCEWQDSAVLPAGIANHSAGFGYRNHW